ncbi:hypothetical protein RB195_015434 [Necator americanus]|uniref:Reverse transcriptase domain-containing protein n=1 Tax=Necator americanus TaxID=51031 RepID=A0ABR1E4J6_NECAM
MPNDFNLVTAAQQQQHALFLLGQHYYAHCSVPRKVLILAYCVDANFTSFIDYETTAVGLRDDKDQICLSVTFAVTIINLNINGTNNRIPFDLTSTKISGHCAKKAKGDALLTASIARDNREKVMKFYFGTKTVLVKKYEELRWQLKKVVYSETYGGVDASYVRTLANCYERCTTRIQLFHRPLTIPIGKGVRQGDTISPKLFTAALQWIMKSLSWEERGIRVDGRFLSNLRFADDIVLFSSSTNEAETMLNELNEAGKRIGLRINRKKTQFMKNAHCEDGGVQLEGFQIVETPSYVYLGRSMNMENDLKEELNRRMRAAWAAFAAVREATDQLTDHDLRAHLFDSTVLPALCYAAETWADTAATSRKLLTTHRALERCLLKLNRRTQHLAGLRSSDLRGMSRLRDPAEYVSKAKHRWAGHIMRRIDDRWTKRTLEWIPRDAKRPRGRPPTRWSDVFAARMDQLRAQLDTAQGPRQRHSRSLRTSWMTMARERNEWKRCWGPHVE